MAAGCWLLAAGCWLLAAGGWRLAAGGWLPAGKSKGIPFGVYGELNGDLKESPLESQ